MKPLHYILNGSLLALAGAAVPAQGGSYDFVAQDLEGSTRISFRSTYGNFDVRPSETRRALRANVTEGIPSTFEYVDYQWTAEDIVINRSSTFAVPGSLTQFRRVDMQIVFDSIASINRDIRTADLVSQGGTTFGLFNGGTRRDGSPAQLNGHITLSTDNEEITQPFSFQRDINPGFGGAMIPTIDVADFPGTILAQAPFPPEYSLAFGDQPHLMFDGTIDEIPILLMFEDLQFFPTTSDPMALRLLGDMNGDGQLTNGDIAPFVLALTDPEGYAAEYPLIDPNTIGDFSGDWSFTNNDIRGFVDALTTTSALQRAVPEPGSLVLLAMGGLLIARRRRA